MNLVDRLAVHASARPERAAFLRHPETHRISFAGLERRSAGWGDWLRERCGIGEGDRVMVLVPLGIDLYTLLLALFRIGAVAVLADPGAGLRGFLSACERAKPRGVVAHPRALPLFLLGAGLRRIPTRIALGFVSPGFRTLDRAAEADAAPVSLDPDAPALLTFTSGSTGSPKGVMRSHGFLVEQGEVLSNELGMEAGEVDCLTLPVFALANLAAGLTTLLPDADLRFPGRVDAARLARSIAEAGASRIAASPALLERLASAPGAADLPLRKIFVGGAPVFPRLLRLLGESFPRAEVRIVYGSSEVEPIAAVRMSEITAGDLRCMESGGGLLAGRVSGDLAIRIPSLRPDGAGEIQVSGRRVVQGYFEGVGDGETKLREGNVVWHRTGDAGRFDEDGRLWLLGRVGAGAGGRFPLEIEPVALQDPTVRRAALVALAGEPVLVVEGEPGPATRGLQESGAVARIHSLRTIPVDRRHNAKVDRASLLRELGVR